MYEERCRGFNLLGFVVREYQIPSPLKHFHQPYNSAFRKIFINLLGKAIFKLSARSPAPPTVFAPSSRGNGSGRVTIWLINGDGSEIAGRYHVDGFAWLARPGDRY